MQLGKDLVAASAAPLVLGVLAEGDSYGYAILQRIGELSGGELDWSEGLLYPLLHRLERLGQVESRWGTAESGRRRRYYALTLSGRAALAGHRAQWDAVHTTLAQVWRGLGLVASGSARSSGSLAQVRRGLRPAASGPARPSRAAPPARGV